MNTITNSTNVDIALGLIHVPPNRLRKLRPEKVDEIAKSIRGGSSNSPDPGAATRCSLRTRGRLAQA